MLVWAYVKENAKSANAVVKIFFIVILIIVKKFTVKNSI